MRLGSHLLFTAGVGLLLTLPACSILVDLDALSEGGDTGAGASGGAPGVFALTDDALDGEFGDGAFENTRWAGDHVEMNGAVSPAFFSSRVLDAGAPATWRTIAWQPQAPYGKALPHQGAAEQGYAEGNADMSANVLLLHLDGQGLLSLDQTLPDSSGLGNDVSVAGSGLDTLAFAPGRFGQAVEDNPFSYLALTIDPGGDLQFGYDDLTWSLWVKTTSDCVGNNVYLGAEDPGAGVAHMWLGCAETLEWVDPCPDEAAGGTRAAGFFISDQGSAVDGGGVCGRTIIDDGRWHHLALTKQGHEIAELRLYVDGELEQSTVAGFINPLDFTSSPELAIGAFSNGTYQAQGAFDEVAIWRRALSDAEIRALHRRGALRLGFQVRACADAGCATPIAYAGPGGSPDTWFDEPPQALAPGAPWELPPAPPAPWFQYRARFESDVAGQSPWLRSVTVTGQR